MRRVGKVGRRRAAALRKLKPLLIARSGNRCENPFCRKTGRLDPHHQPKRSQSSAPETLEGVLLLCRRCHNATDLPVAKGRLEIRIRWEDGRAFAMFQSGALIQARPLSLSEENS